MTNPINLSENKILKEPKVKVINVFNQITSNMLQNMRRIMIARR